MKIDKKKVLGELQREISLRKSLYPKWIANGKMNQENARKQLLLMQSAHEFVKRGALLPGTDKNSICDEIKRELSMRESVYPRWITRGTLNAHRAALYMKRLEAAIILLKDDRIEPAGDQQTLF